MNAALLLRVSTARQAASELPIERQERECRDFAAARGWTVTEVFSDPGVSGGKDELSRDGLAALLAAADAGRIGAVIMWSWSRLARDEDLSGHLRWLLRRAGVQPVSVTEPDDHPLIRAVGAWKDAEYRRDCSRHSVSAHRQAAREGRKIASDPFGFTWTDVRTLAPHPTEAPLYAQMFGWYLEGMPAGEIARRAGRHRSRVYTLLRSRLPIGDYVYGQVSASREVTVLQDHHPAIVDRETWQAVQDLIDSRGWGEHRRSRARIPEAEVLTCGECGAPMEGRGTYVSGTTGRTHRNYRCRAGCLSVTLLDGTATLARAVLEELQRPGVIDLLVEVAREAWQAGHDTAEMEAEVRRLERSERSITRAIESGEIADPGTLARSLGETQRALAGARQRLTSVSTAAPSAIDATAVSARLQAIARLDTPEAGALVRELVERVDLFRAAVPMVTMRTGAVVPLPEVSRSSRRARQPWQFAWEGAVSAAPRHARGAA